MKHLIAAVAMLVPAIAQAQSSTDVVVMRQRLSAPRPKPTPTPTPTPAVASCGAFNDGKWVNYAGAMHGRVDLTASNLADMKIKAAAYCASFGQAAKCQIAYVGSGASAQVTAYKTGTIENQGSNGYSFSSATCTAP